MCSVYIVAIVCICFLSFHYDRVIVTQVFTANVATSSSINAQLLARPNKFMIMVSLIYNSHKKIHNYYYKNN